MIAPVRPDVPVAGHYAMPLVKGGLAVPIRIWFGQPVIDGEEQDRSPRWCVEVDGQPERWEADEETGYRCRVPRDVFEVWPYCARQPISEREYRFLLKRAAWAREHAPHHPAANPRERIDVRALPPAF